MNNVFLYKYFTVYFDHLHFPRAGEYNEIVNIGTVANIFIFAQRSTHKTFGSIDIEFKIAHHHFLGIYIVESADFWLTLSSFSVVFLQLTEIVNRKIYEVIEVVFNRGNIFFQRFNALLCFVDIKFRNTLDSNFC